jgi:hypothetical protein
MLMVWSGEQLTLTVDPSAAPLMENRPSLYLKTIITRTATIMMAPMTAIMVRRRRRKRFSSLISGISVGGVLIQAGKK